MSHWNVLITMNGFTMATENYPEILPHPLVKGGFEQTINTSQRVGLFDVDVLSTDEVNQFSVSFTFTDLQFKVFHGWFMHIVSSGQKWFNMRLNDEMYECSFGGSQPKYTRANSIMTVSVNIVTRVSPGLTVNYTNQVVTYSNLDNKIPSPFDPSGWYGSTNDPDLSYQSVTEPNPSGESFVGEFEYVGTGSATTLLTGFTLGLSIGDFAYFSIITKQDIGIDSIRCFFQYSDGGTISDGSPVIHFDGSGFLPSGWETKVTQLSDDYALLQVRMLANHDQNYRIVIYLQSGNSTPTIGNRVKMQAAFFGKADDWPAFIKYEF